MTRFLLTTLFALSFSACMGPMTGDDDAACNFSEIEYTCTNGVCTCDDDEASCTDPETTTEDDSSSCESVCFECVD